MGKLNWNPWMEGLGGDSLREQMDRCLRGECACADPDCGCAWQPTADVVETPSAFILKVDLPGVDIAQVSIELQGDTLAIFGQRPLSRETFEHVYHALECSYGPFARTFRLAPGLDPDTIQATLKNGQLVITVPKQSPTRRTIDVE